MQLPALITSDLHLDAAPSCSYRFDLFPWLVKQAEAERAKTILILGDVTDQKDNHPAELVAKVVSSVRMLAKVARVVILAGNHDWLRKGHEFFKFLDDPQAGITFVTRPWEDTDLEGPPAIFLPHSKDPARDWAGFDLSHYRYAFMHQTVRSSVASNGQRMSGEQVPDMSAAGKVYSGDIHVPQVVNEVEYVGSPYHVHFGDKFTPRVVVLEKNGNPENLFFKTTKRISLKVAGLDELQLRVLHDTMPGDQVKVSIALDSIEALDWRRIKREALWFLVAHGVEIHGIELVLQGARKGLARTLSASAPRRPEEDVERFVRAEELGGDALDMGLDIVEETK